MQRKPRATSALLIPTPMARPGQTIGLFGGSFNPPHEGHAVVANTALRRLSLDALWWIVTPGNPLKGHGELADQATRMAECRALARDRRMIVTGFETALGSPYTASTLTYLAKRFPETQFVWIMGADNLAQFHRWQNWRGIVRSMPIAVVDRPGWRMAALASPAARAMAQTRLYETAASGLARRAPPAWVFLPARLSHMSSSELRDKVK